MKTIQKDDLIIEILPEHIRDAPSLFDVIWDALSWFYNQISSLLQSLYNDYVKPHLESLVTTLSNSFSAILDPIKETINSIKDYLVSLVQDLWSIIRYPLEWIRNAIYSIGNSLYGALVSVQNAIISTASNVSSWIYNSAQIIVSGLRSAILSVFSSISSILQHIGTRIWSVISTIGSTISHAITRIGSLIGPYINNITNTLRIIHHSLINVANIIVNQIRQSWKETFDFLSRISNTIYQSIISVGNNLYQVGVNIYNFFKDPYNNILVPLGRNIYHFISWLITNLKSTAVHISSILSHTLEDIFTVLSDVFCTVISKITEFILRPTLERAAYGRGSPQFVEWFYRTSDPLGWLLVSAFRTFIEYPPPQTADKAWAAAQKFVSLTFIMGLIQALGDLVEDIIFRIITTRIAATGLGQFGIMRRGMLTRIISSAYWALGIGWLTWMTFGPVLNAVISRPLSEYYLEKYRPEGPTRAQVQRWLRLRLIDQSEAWRELAKMGYKDEYIKKMLQDLWRVPTLSMISDLYEYGLISDAQVYEYVRKLGYSDTDAVFIAELIKRRTIAEYRRKYINVIYKDLKRGRIDPAEAKMLFIQSGLSPLRAEWMVYAAQLELQDEIIDYKIKAAIEQYEKGYIDENELRDILSDYIKDANLIDAIIEYATIKRLPKIRIPPLQRLQERLRRLEFKKKSIEAQIQRLITIRKETQDVYRARLQLLEAKKKAIEDYYNSLIEALETELKAELEAYKEKTIEQINARIEYLKKVKEIKLKAKQEELEAYETRTQRELEARKHVLEFRLQDLKRRLEEELSKPEEEQNKYLIERLTYQIEEILARIEALEAMIEARLEYRRDKVAELMYKESEIYDAKIELLERMKEVAVEYREAVLTAILEARKKRLEATRDLKLSTIENRILVLKEEMERRIKDYEERINILKIRLEFIENEIDAIKQVIAKYYPEYLSE